MKASLGLFAICLLLGSSIGAQPADRDLRARASALRDGETLDSHGVTMTMHHRAVGARQPDGWFEARSTGCGFTVRLPTPSSDYSLDAPTTDGNVLHLHIVAMGTADGEKFTATCSRRSDGTIPAGWAESTLAALGSGQRLLSKSALTLGSLAGYEAHIESTSGAHLLVRLMGDDKTAYELTVEFPRSQAAAATTAASSFFASFRP